MISKDKVKEYRKLKGLSQEKLASLSGLSLRTIQRIEKGTSDGSPYTLQSLAKALDRSPEELLLVKEEVPNIESEEIAKLKVINLSALSIILIPLGNLLFPILSFWKYRSKKSITEMGQKILSFQIMWSLVSLLMLLISPFFRHPLNHMIQGEIFTASKMPVLIYIALVSFNVFITIKTASDINKQQKILSFVPNIL